MNRRDVSNFLVHYRQASFYCKATIRNDVYRHCVCRKRLHALAVKKKRGRILPFIQEFRIPCRVSLPPVEFLTHVSPLFGLRPGGVLKCLSLISSFRALFFNLHLHPFHNLKKAKEKWRLLALTPIEPFALRQVFVLGFVSNQGQLCSQAPKPALIHQVRRMDSIRMRIVFILAFLLYGKDAVDESKKPIIKIEGRCTASQFFLKKKMKKVSNKRSVERIENTDKNHRNNNSQLDSQAIDGHLGRN
ncbi:hypothetical protein CDAR_492611 [Caerostris darwini]|uniref:Uncharacterized protein n=1 Tax=Caerostris darwini TaxID=1538125 RepID=A0AAV4UYV0_9ARAC|nr:hypothetical protein CDAR_492611 [Caerostris darwini]